MRGNPLSLSCVIVDRVYVLRRFKELNVRSHLHVVPGNVQTILSRIEYLGRVLVSNGQVHSEEWLKYYLPTLTAYSSNSLTQLLS